MKKYFTKWVNITIVFCALFFTIGFYYSFHWPQFKQYLKVQIQNYSYDKLPFIFEIDDIDIVPFPVGIKFKNFIAKPKKDLKKTLKSIEISEVHAYLSLVALIQGHFKLSAIKLFEPKVVAIIKKKDYNQNTGQLKQNKIQKLTFDQIKKLPLGRLEIKHLQVLAKVEELNHSVFSPDLDLILEKQSDSLFFDINVSEVSIKKRDQKQKLRFSIKSRMIINESELHITYFDINEKNLRFLAEGKLSGDLKNSKLNSYKLKSNLKLNLSQIDHLKNYFVPQIDIPFLNGHIDFNLLLDSEIQENAKASLKTKNLKINKFNIGNINTDTQLQIRKNSENKNIYALSSDLIELKNKKLNIQLHQFFMNISDKVKFTTQIKINELELHHFLNLLNIKNAPLKLDVDGTSQCQGEISPELLIKCNSQFNAKNFSVFTDNDNNKDKRFHIVDVEKVQTQGDVEIDTKKVKYNATLKMENSSGTSYGEIDYKKGFLINFKGQNLSFKDVKNVSNLKLEGETEIEGKTWGDTSFGRIQLKAKNKNFWISDFYTGNNQLHLNYRKGILYFSNLNGRVNRTQYTGDFKVNLLKSKLNLHAISPFLRAQDLQTVFQRKVTLPFNVFGNGSATLNVHGPLQFNKLSYDLESSLFKGQLFNESFHLLRFNVASNNGFVRSKNIYLQKGSGRISIQGRVDPNAQSSLSITGDQLYLKEFEHISQLGTQLNGRLSFSSQLKGHLLSPNYNAKFLLDNVYLDNEPVADSLFKFAITDKSINGSGRFIGDKINFQLQYPKKEVKQPFLFKLKTTDLNYINLFTLFSESDQYKIYDSNINSEINLLSKNGNPWDSSGFVNVSKVRLNKGALALVSKAPLFIEFKDGASTPSQLDLIGENAFVNLKFGHLKKSNLELHSQGSLDFSLLSILFPLEYIQGPMSFNIKTSGSFDQFKILGSSYSNSTDFKISQFPHPFENINYDILFNEKRLLINSMKGQLGGGPFLTTGKIHFDKIKNIPIDLKGSINNTTLNIPEGVQTKGSGDFRIHGHWFPYTLSANYLIQSGEVNLNFSKKETQSTARFKRLLPQILGEDSFQPLVFDINTKIDQSLPVKNNDFTGQIEGQMKITGYPSEPILKGKISSSQGQIQFRDHQFTLSHANIIYENTPASNPGLDILAKSQHETEDFTYDIQLNILGSAEKPDVALTSQPPLKHDEIVSLLALGVSNSDIDQNNTDQQLANQTSYQLGSAILASPIGKQVKNKLGVEVQLSQDFDDSNTSIPKFIIKKQITKKFSATASRTIEKFPKTDLKLKYNLNKSLSVIGLLDTEEGDVEESEKSNAGVDFEYKVNFK